MPSTRVTANQTTAQTVAAEIRNARYKITSLTIDNKAGGGDRQITIQDIFTTDVTNGQSATATTVNRFTQTALQGDVINLGKEELEGVRCIGAIKVISDVTDASCYITVGYELD